ncbi:MAG: hypothetical protein IKU52_02060 [Clostridia bacterium]|nr:hypothetical protein [Clostridia bacterium]
MKKSLCLVLFLAILLSCLTGCTLAENLTKKVSTTAESTHKVQEMMQALSEGRINDAAALIHPEAEEESDAAIKQMSDYISSRKVKSMDITNLNINSSTDTSGKSRREEIGYTVILTDDTVIHIDAKYLSNKEGSGFTSFRLALGLI